MLTLMLPVIAFVALGLCLYIYKVLQSYFDGTPNTLIPPEWDASPADPQNNDADNKNEAASIKSALMDNVNHELRTPLAGIMATAQILHDEVGPHHQELTEMLVENSRRMNNAISNVIELVAFKDNAYQIDSVPVQISEELESMRMLYLSQAQAKGISLDLELDTMDLTLKTDPQLLRKVLNHLINNAIKFTDEGSVKLTVKKDHGWLHVEIKDTGIGINRAFLPNIYKPFMQASQGLARSYNGQGLGLALTKRMIDLAGGKISIASSSGSGSTFTVSYPNTEEAL